MTHMDLPIKGFKSIRRWFFTTSFCILFWSVGISQLPLRILFNQEVHGSINLFKITADTSEHIYYKSFYGDTVNIVLERNKDEVKEGLIVRYTIDVLNDKKISSSVLLSEYITTINFELNQFDYDKSHPFYSLFSKVRKPKVFPKDSIIYELLKLKKMGVYPAYFDYLIWMSYDGGYISNADLYNYFEDILFNKYWPINLENQSTTFNIQELILDSLINSISSDSLIVLKFWGSWCKPCLRDNEKIISDIKSGSLGYKLIGIQRDKSKKKEKEYANVLDPDGQISLKYNVKSFPTYIIISNGIILKRTSTYDEIKPLVLKYNQ